MADKTADEIDLDKEPTPLPKMSCRNAKCEENLHCFLPKKPKRTKERPKGRSIQLELFDNPPAPEERGMCQSCGKQFVDWARVHRRDLRDVAYTLSMLRLEWVRNVYWHRPLTPHERNYAIKKGRSGMRIAAEKRLRRSIGPKEPYRDERQTPWDGKGKTHAILYYAQHATASCCRNCIAVWHNIPVGRELTEEEIEYLTDLLCRYVVERMPELTEQGMKVPPIRKKKMATQG